MDSQYIIDVQSGPIGVSPASIVVPIPDLARGNSSSVRAIVENQVSMSFRIDFRDLSSVTKYGVRAAGNALSQQPGNFKNPIPIADDITEVLLTNTAAVAITNISLLFFINR